MQTTANIYVKYENYMYVEQNGVHPFSHFITVFHIAKRHNNKLVVKGIQ